MEFREEDVLGEGALRSTVAEYYTLRLQTHGTTPRGVDWNSEASQLLRFEQLLAVCKGLPERAYSINDYGCGYGALVDFLDRRGDQFTYTGFDIAPAMVTAARRRYAGRDDCTFTDTWDAVDVADVSVASGVFNVRLDSPDAVWMAHLRTGLSDLARISRYAFAFNVLSLRSDPERRRRDLFYADPDAVLAECRQRFSQRSYVVDGYGLWEFTVVVPFDEPSVPHTCSDQESSI
jgi:SAM-dependent methyltransferase